MSVPDLAPDDDDDLRSVHNRILHPLGKIDCGTGVLYITVSYIH